MINLDDYNALIGISGLIIALIMVFYTMSKMWHAPGEKNKQYRVFPCNTNRVDLLNFPRFSP